MIIHTVKLTKKKAEEYQESFPDGMIPVTSNRMDFDAISQSYYYHIDNSVLTWKQSKFLVEQAKKKNPQFENELDNDILARAAVKREDICCPDCGIEGSHNCQAVTDSHYVQSMDEDEGDGDDDDEFDGEDDDGEEEPELDFTGSLMEAQLTQQTEDNQCRQCRGFFEELRGKPMPEKFCSEKCKKEWEALAEARINIGIHDLETRGFD